MRYLLIITILFTQAAAASSVLPAHVYSACNIPTTDTTKVKTVVDDKLIFELDQHQLNWQKIIPTLSKYKIEKEPFKTTHGSNSVYHIAKITVDENQLSYFYTEHKQFPVCISLSTTTTILPSFTMLKQQLSFFQRKYHFDEAIEQLVITNLESGIKITLFFSKNVLTKFVYHTVYVD